MKINELHNQPVEADTYEASMALNQLLKIGKHAIKIHNMIKDDAEMEAWVQKKIDLAGDYVKKVHGYMQGEQSGLYDDGGLTTEGCSKHKVKEDISEKGRIALEKAGFDPIKVKEYMAVFNDHGDTSDIDQMNMDKVGLADAMGMVLASHDAGDMYPKSPYSSDPKYRSKESVKEDAPFDGMSLLRMAIMRKFITVQEWDLLKHKWKDAVEELEQRYDDWPEDQGFGSSDHAYAIKELMELVGYEFDDQDRSGRFVITKQPEEIEKAGIKNARMKGQPVAQEDAGEGHMSKSTLYHTAKYAIELMEIIKKGDDLEGWVQSKLNKAADYLQGVHNYEEYQKLNPYREELSQNVLQKHAQVVQKHIDEILARETSLDDVDTKPGMMRILAKKVNEVEKELAKETRTDEAPIEQDRDNPIAKPYVDTPEWKALHDMDDKIIQAYIKHKEVKEYDTPEKKAQRDALMKKYLAKGGKVEKVPAGKKAYKGKELKPQYKKDPALKSTPITSPMSDESINEGLKDWAKSLAMAGIFVAGLAGVGSINDAINNSVPVVKAMNSALEIAQDNGDDELVKMIQKDIDGAKLRLDIGRDLNQVKYLQKKYSKFMPTEGLAYESKLAIMLNQRLK